MGRLLTRVEPTLHRAALGSMEKNNEPARATVIIASPAAERAWTLLSLTKVREQICLYLFRSCCAYFAFEEIRLCFNVVVHVTSLGVT